MDRRGPTDELEVHARLGAIVERIPIAALLVDASTRVLAVNRAGVALLRACRSLVVSEGQLRCTSPGAQVALRALVVRASALHPNTPIGPALLPTGLGESPDVQVIVAPFVGGEEGLVSGAYVLLTETDRLAQALPQLAAVQGVASYRH